MVGGPNKCSRFRPLSLTIPKPLFPLAGQPMVHHAITACKRIPNLAQIYLVGFYEEREFALYVSSISNELRVTVRGSQKIQRDGNYISKQESTSQFGELVADPNTNEVLHYTAKPETFISDKINCGVYVLTPDIFNAIQDVSTHRKDTANLRRMSSFEALQSATKSLP